MDGSGPVMDTYDLAELYRDAAFARRLAAGLVGEASSEDVWQDAWRTLLERPPRTDSNLRGYVRTLVRRLALRHRRSEGRRRRRERVVARDELLPSTEALVERVEIHRIVVDAVLELEEPYRRTILLAFFDGLPAAEIARREGSPLETVRTRMKRALARLRARLVQAHGGEREWLQELVALAGLRGPVGGEAARTGTTLALGAGAAALVIGVALWWLRREAVERASQPTTFPATAVAGGEDQLAPAREEAGSRVAGVVQGSTELRAAPEGEFRVHGRVADASGAGMNDVDVALRMGGVGSVQPLASERTDRDGYYAFRIQALSPLTVRARWLEIEAWTSGFQPVLAEIPLNDLRSPMLQHDLVLTPGRMLEGKVVDERGEPVKSALVIAHCASSDGSVAPRGATTDHLGMYRLAFESDRELERVEAVNNAVGTGSLAEAELPRSREPLLRAPDLVLQMHATLRGRAIHPDGTPVSDLAVGVFLVQEDEQGRFVPAPSTPVGEGGLSRSNGYTDEEGRFALRGLREGPYAFGPSSDPPRALEGGVPRDRVARTGLEDALLIVDRHRVLLEVVGPAGEALEDVAVACTPLAPASIGAGVDWWPAGESIRSVTRGSGRAAFTCAPASTIALSVFLPGRAREFTFTVPERPYETIQRVELAESEPPGSLRIHATDAGHGGPLTELEVRLATAWSRIPLDGSWRSDARGLVRGLPAGNFRVEIVSLSGAGGDECPPAALLPALDIPAGDPVELEVPLARGGRLAVFFQRSDDETAEDEATRHDAAHAAPAGWITWNTEKPRARLWCAADPAGSPPFLALRGAAPGRRWESDDPLPAGRYRLEAEFEGFEPLQLWLDVDPCRTNEIVVRLDPLPGAGR